MKVETCKRFSSRQINLREYRQGVKKRKNSIQRNESKPSSKIRKAKSTRVSKVKKEIDKEQHSSCVKELLGSLRSLDPSNQLEIWKFMIENHSFDLKQLRSLRTAIDDRIRLDILSHVPYEIALYIVSFLTPKDLCQAAQTCRSWRIICEDNRLWREQCEKGGLLVDEQTLDVLFQRRISNQHVRHGKIVIDCLPDDLPKSLWKTTYLKHMSILKNWRTRKFEFSKSFITQNIPQDDPSCALDSSVENLMQLRCHEDSVITCLQYNPKSNTIVSGSDDQTLKVWSGDTGRCIATLEGHTGGVWSSQLSPDDTVISGSTDRTLKVWKAHTGELVHTLYGHTSTVRCLALDGKFVVSGSRDTTLRLWNIETGNCTEVFSGHSAAVRCVQYKNNIIVSGSYDFLVMVWDALTGTCQHSLECHSDKVYSLQFDGTTIASGSLDSTICIWDAASGKLRHQLKGHISLTSKIQLKGDLLVSANADKLCKVWNINTGECLHTLEGENKHTSAITSVYFNDGHVVTSSDDGTVKLWDIKTGEFIRNLIVLPTASQGAVVWRIRASYTKLICAVGFRDQTEDTHLLVLNFSA